MRKTLALGLILATTALFSGCATIDTGSGPHASERDIQGVSMVKRDITFSVEFHDDYGPEAWFDREEIIEAIRSDLEKSNLFGRIFLTSPDQISDRHYHFKVHLTGTDMNTRMAMAMLSGFSLMTIPVWNSTQLDWSMSYVHKGKEVFASSSQQSASDVLWLPGAVTWPFLNHATIGRGMKHKALYYFIKEIRRNRLNELP